MMEAEAGGVWPQAQDAGSIPYGASGGTVSFLVSRTERQYIWVVLNHQVWGNVFSSPGKPAQAQLKWKHRPQRRSLAGTGPRARRPTWPQTDSQLTAVPLLSAPPGPESLCPPLPASEFQEQPSLSQEKDALGFVPQHRPCPPPNNRDTGSHGCLLPRRSAYARFHAVRE